MIKPFEQRKQVLSASENPTPKVVRAGWAEASMAIATAGDDALVWPEFPNEDDRIDVF
jgi:hypothetical protein